MISKKEILVEVKDYAERVLKEEFPEGLVYHGLEHTRNVVNAAKEIGEHTHLSSEEMEIVELAAWFHDLGYKNSISDHEERSVELAQKFLKEHNLDDDKIVKVMGCIMATKMPQSPTNMLEKIVCDADLLHLSTDKYFEQSSMLKKEIENLSGEQYSEIDWMDSNKTFFKKHTYFTDYVNEKYADQKQENLKKVKKKLKSEKKQEKYIEDLEKSVAKLEQKLAKAKDLKPDRGIETMFRLTSKNHLDLSSMADNKANIMISINSIILSILISVLYRKLEEYPHMLIPTIILTIVCLVTIVFSILATRPNVTSGLFTREDILNKRTNLLFFGNFHNMKLDDYEWGMKEMMKDADYLYGSLTKDIYFLGKVLGKKYRMLRAAYTIFMFGFVIAVLSFAIAETFFKAPYPY